MATTYYADIQKLYVAYFNRPADVGGLQFWETVLEGNNGNTAVISAEFAKSAEYTEAYGNKTAYQVVAAIYQNLFGREADVAGLNFWAQHLIAGDYTVDQAVTIIANAAQNDDAKVIANKVTAATAFTGALDTTAEIIGYSGAKANAEAVKFLSGITADEDALATAIAPANLDKTVNTVVGIGNQAAGQTFTLTTGVDTIVGTTGNDTIVATTSGDSTITSGATLGNLDVIDGGAGYDTFNITNANNGDGLTIPSSLQVSNVEAAVLRNATGSVDVDFSNWTGLETVTVDQRSGNYVDVVSNGNVTSVAITGGDEIYVSDDSDDDTLTTVSLNGNTDRAEIYSDVLANLSVSNTDESTYVYADAGTRALNVTVNAVTDGAIISDVTATTVNLNSTGAASNIELITDAATTVTFAGDKKITVAMFDDASSTATVNTITSTNSAGVTITSQLGNNVTFTGGAGNDKVTVGATTKAIDLGAGDDTVVVTSALGTGGSISGGEGTNTLSLSAALATTLTATDTFSKAIDGFSKVAIGAVANNTAATVSLTNLDNINYVVSAGTGLAGVFETNSFALNDLALGTSITIAGRTVTATQNLTAAQVASAFAGSTVTGAAVTGNLSATWTPSVVTTTPGTIVFTTNQSGDVANLSATTAGVARPTIGTNTTQGVADVVTGPSTVTPGTPEQTVVTFTNLVAGQSVTVNGYTVTASADATATDVINALRGITTPNVTRTGTVVDTNWGANYSVDGQVTYTYATTTTNPADLEVSTLGVVAPNVPTVADVTGEQGSTLAVNGLTSGGTFELTGAITGVTTLSVTDATLSGADVLNIKLNGAANLLNTGTLNVAGVETLNITTADSDVNANPTAASSLKIVDAAATTIVVSGNHGIDFTGSSLGSLTTLDASGVTATGSAATIALAGKVTFTSQVTDKALTISTGNGADVIDLSSNTKGATVSTGAGGDIIHGSSGTDTIDAGAGRDFVYSSAGGDTITLGAGNDVFLLTDAAHSTLAKSTTITDFSANTKAAGTSAAAIAAGATGTTADLTGDTIDLTLLKASGISVLVVNSAADAQTFLQNTATTTAYNGIALDTTTGKLYIDLDHNGTADSVITLTGVTTITEAAFVIHTPQV